MGGVSVSRVGVSEVGVSGVGVTGWWWLWVGFGVSGDGRTAGRTEVH